MPTLFPERIPKADMGKRPSLWPLQDLLETPNANTTIEQSNVTRDSAKMTVGQLYPEVAIASHPLDAESIIDNPFKEGLVEAQSSVILTVELLELILSFLPGPDLWRARNTCHSWQELVMTSPSLRRALWLTTDTPAEAPVRYKPPRDAFQINPVLESLNLVKPMGYGLFKLAEVNFPARWRTVKAPWREMQICHPPISTVFLTSSWLDKYLECETGITAGQLADRLELSRVGTLSSYHSG